MTTLSFGTAVTSTSVIRRDCALRFQHRQQLLGLRLHQTLRAARLDVEPYQGFGVRAAQIEAPILKFEGYPVGAIQNDGLRCIACLEGSDGRLGVGDPVVELAADWQ